MGDFNQDMVEMTPRRAAGSLAGLPRSRHSGFQALRAQYSGVHEQFSNESATAVLVFRHKGLPFALGVEEAAKEWAANLIPGVTVIPSGTWGVSRAQEAGCTYCAGGLTDFRKPITRGQRTNREAGRRPRVSDPHRHAAGPAVFGRIRSML